MWKNNQKYENTPLLSVRYYGIICAVPTGERPPKDANEKPKNKEQKDDDNGSRTDEPDLRVRARVRGHQPGTRGQGGRAGHGRNGILRRLPPPQLGGDDARRSQVAGGERRQPLGDFRRGGHADPPLQRHEHPAGGGQGDAQGEGEGERAHGGSTSMSGRRG